MVSFAFHFLCLLINSRQLSLSRQRYLVFSKSSEIGVGSFKLLVFTTTVTVILIYFEGLLGTFVFSSTENVDLFFLMIYSLCSWLNYNRKHVCDIKGGILG